MKLMTDTARQALLALALAGVLLPAPARAQWTVFDPANYGLEVKNRIDALLRWAETVDQYARMYENAVAQLTHLQGLLRLADEALAQDKRLRALISNWGQAVRLTLRLKSQVVNLVTGAARALKNIDDRLRRGVFDPEADRRDFAEYLRYGIGRTAEDAEAEIERLKGMDNQLERISYEEQREAAALAELHAYIAAKSEEVEALKSCADCTEKDRDLERLSFEVGKLEERAARAEADLGRLRDAKAKRVEEIYRLEAERTRFGRSVRAMSAAWRGMSEATNRLREGLSDGR